MAKFNADTISTQRIELSEGSTNQTFKFSEIDTSVLTTGIDKGQTYEYTLNFTGDVSMVAEVRLVGKIYSGDNTKWITALFNVAGESLAYTDFVNIYPQDMRCFVTREYSSGTTSYTLKIDHQLNTTMYFTAYIDGYSYKNVAGASSVRTNKLFGDRGVFGGGYEAPITVSTIDYITISTPSNASPFGVLFEARNVFSATSDGSIGVFGGGAPTTNTIDYITISTPSDALNFGDLTLPRQSQASTSDGSIGVFGGGYNSTLSPNILDTIDYITISTPSNASPFGNLIVGRYDISATSDGSRGVFGGGNTPSIVSTIEYITIGSTSGSVTATDFGGLTESKSGLTATSDGSRGVFGGGTTPGIVNTIDYITISTPSDATDFGDLTVSRYYLAATSDGSRGVFGGGYNNTFSPNRLDNIDYITISTPSDATVFGNLFQGRSALAATSGD